MLVYVGKALWGKLLNNVCLAGLIDEVEVEGMLDLVENRLRKLHFQPSQSFLPPVSQMMMQHYLFAEMDEKMFDKVR